MWLLGVWGFGIGQLTGTIDDALLNRIDVSLFASVGCWCLMTLVGCAVLLRRDRPGIVVGNRFVLWTIVATLNIGGPVAVGWGLIQAF